MGEVVIILVEKPPRNSKSRYDEYRSLMSMNICDYANYPTKPIGGDFNAEYVRQHKNHQIGLRTQESYILKC